MIFVIVILIFYIIRLATYKKEIKKLNPKLKIKNYNIFYADKKMEDENIITGKLFKSEKYNLVGKPDYILKHNKKDSYIPIELKSGSIGDADFPNGNDLIQLSAYFIILEESFGVKIREGRLIYSDAMFVVRNNKSLKNKVLQTMDDMNYMLETGVGDVEPSFVKCRYCKCNGTVCEYC